MFLSIFWLPEENHSHRPRWYWRLSLTFLLSLAEMRAWKARGGGAFIKLCRCQKCQGEKPSEDIEVVGKWSRSRVQPCSTQALQSTGQPNKAAHALADHSLEGVSGDDVIQPFSMHISSSLWSVNIQMDSKVRKAQKEGSRHLFYDSQYWSITAFQWTGIDWNGIVVTPKYKTGSDMS